jgi:hypothetical protein
MLFTPIHKIEELEQREHVDQTISALFGVSRKSENETTLKEQVLIRLFDD